MVIGTKCIGFLGILYVNPKQMAVSALGVWNSLTKHYLQNKYGD